MTTTHVRIARFAATVAAVAALVACTSGDGEGAAGTPGAATSPATSAQATDAGREGDIRFAQMMIPHHEQAIEMAEMALAAEDVSPAVQAFARDIEAAQAPEIAQMRGWLGAWGAPESGSGHEGHGAGDDGTGMGMMSAEEMAELAGAAGSDFDTRWLTMMIAHHEGAVTMAQEVLGSTADPQVRDLAEAVVATQRAEIEAMRAEL